MEWQSGLPGNPDRRGEIPWYILSTKKSLSTGVKLIKETMLYITVCNNNNYNNNNNNLAKTTTDKQNKYKELANAICAVWKQKAAHLIPIAIPSTQ
jgi:hypothetical protein